MSEKDPATVTNPATERASILNLLRGGLVEMADDELQKVADNVLDLNTSAKATRKIVITIAIKPDEDRSIAATTVSVTSKLAACAPQATRLFVGQQRGKGVLVEHDPQQPPLPGVTPEKPRAVKA